MVNKNCGNCAFVRIGSSRRRRKIYYSCVRHIFHRIGTEVPADFVLDLTESESIDHLLCQDWKHRENVCPTCKQVISGTREIEPINFLSLHAQASELINEEG